VNVDIHTTPLYYCCVLTRSESEDGSVRHGALVDILQRIGCHHERHEHLFDIAIAIEVKVGVDFDVQVRSDEIEIRHS
jgi:hypothetical protein